MLRQVLEGNVRIALAQGDSCARRSRTQQSRVTALASQEGFSLSGRVNVVYGAPWSTHIIVSSSMADDSEQAGNCLIALLGRAEQGLALREYRTIDGGPGRRSRDD